MNPTQRKSKKYILAEKLLGMIDRNPSSAALVLLTVVLLPWSMELFSPSLKFLALVVGPHIWKGTDKALRGTAEWMTQPNLFLLMNVMILSIMFSSGTISLARIEIGKNSLGRCLSSKFSSASSHQNSKTGLTRSQSNSVEFGSNDSYFWDPSFGLHADKEGKSNPPRHTRSLSLPLSEADNWASAPSFPISPTKQQRTHTMLAESHAEIYQEEHLQHKSKNCCNLPSHDEEDDDIVQDVGETTKLGNQTAFGYIDIVWLKKTFLSKFVAVESDVGKKAGNEHLEEANTLNIRNAIDKMSRTASSYVWNLRRSAQEHDENVVSHQPVTMKKTILDEDADSIHPERQSFAPDKLWLMRSKSTSGALSEPRRVPFQSHSLSMESRAYSSSSFPIQKSEILSKNSTVGVHSEKAATSIYDDTINEKDELTMRIEAFLAKHRLQRQKEIESLQHSTGGEASTYST